MTQELHDIICEDSGDGSNLHFARISNNFDR